MKNGIFDVISSAKCAAPVVTHKLKSYGNGSMGEGIFSLCADCTVIEFSACTIIFLLPKAIHKIREMCRRSEKTELQEEENRA